ncbi:MAG TPA: universal stress protein, partial [Mycobacterium sp.]|nr:universal stress protein [Mycobacterium sp.]
MTDASAPEIVVGCDGSASSHSAIRWAAHEAGMRNVALRLVHVGAAPAVINVMRSVPVEFEEWQDQQARQVLAEATALVAEIGTETGVPVRIADA